MLLTAKLKLFTAYVVQLIFSAKDMFRQNGSERKAGYAFVPLTLTVAVIQSLVKFGDSCFTV